MTPFHEGAVKAAKALAFHEARSPPQARHRPGMYSSSSSSYVFFFSVGTVALQGRGFLFAGTQAKMTLFGLSRT